MNQKEIGKFIQKLRKEKELTQEQLADKLGITNKAVSKWETGKCIPDIEIMKLMAEFFDIELTDILAGERLSNKQSTSEIENDSDIRMISIKEATELTANSIKFYKEVEKKRLNKRIKWLISIIILLIFLLSGIYIVNNYNKCQVYSIKSDIGEVSLSGILTVTNNSSTLAINNVVYSGSNVDNVIAFEYYLMINNKYIYKSGNIESFKNNRINDNKSIVECLKQLNIYLERISKGSIDQLISSKGVFIRFVIINEQGVEKIYDIPLKLKKEYSNSHLLYVK